MKSFRTSILFSCIFIAAVVLSLVSCKKHIINEMTINDFTSLSAEFETPPSEYTTSPFFVWNYKITKEEIDSFLLDFKNQGSSQVFIHPRPGLVTEYLSDEWFELFRYSVEKGRELGMKIWIYDENSYPSGFAGGHVPDQMPESYNQGQGLAMTKYEMLPDTADKYYLCLKEDNGNYFDITSSLEKEKGKSGKYYLFSKTYYARTDWYGGFSYVDLILPGVTQKFIETTMAGYEKAAGDEFGKIVPGIFTDEPEIVSSGGIRWTPDLFEVFQERWGYDLKTHLLSLYEETGDFRKIRHNYTQTLLQLFIDRWAKPYYEYCEEKGLKFTGHYWEHEWPNMRPGGDNMAMYAWHQIPAIDMLFNQWNDSTPRGQFGNVRSVKELSSAANQTGRQRKLSETYGGAGWELTFTDMKRLGDWEYALGVNLMNQHLSHITLAGARKYDYPPTFTYHEPWWDNYKYINDHYARLSLALSSGRQKNSILVLEPTTSAWLYDSYVNRNSKTGEIGQAFQTFITTLEKSQVEYDLGSENIIKDRGSVKKGTLNIGMGSYTTVVIPPMTENLDLSTFKLLKRFVGKGGILVAFSVPTLIDGSKSKELNEFFDLNAGKTGLEEKLTPEIIKKYFVGEGIRFEGVTGGDLYHHRRILSDGELIFMVNSSLEDPLKGSLKTTGKDALELVTLTGSIKGYPAIKEGKEMHLNFELPPAGSLLLFISSRKKYDFPVQAAPAAFKVIPATSPITVTCENENVMPIEFCDLFLGKNSERDLHTYDAADKVFKYHGFKNGNPWNTSVQFKTSTVDRDTFKTNSGFTATYHFNVKEEFDFSSIKAVTERPELWQVVVNGKKVNHEEATWWLDRSFGVFNIGTLVRTGKNTISLITSPMRIHAEIEPVYIVGDFSVRPAKKGWAIEAPVKLLTTGSWKEQGLPFYSRGISYINEFNIDDPDGQYLVSLDKWKGTVAEVTVNGQSAPLIAFPPFQSDISGMLKPGINKIEVKVIGSLKNLLGPHFNDPVPGLVSPWHFRNVKSYPGGSDYQLLDYGLMEDFKVIHAQ